MSEAEPTDPPEAPEQPVPARPRSGRGLAALALFLALLACGGSGGLAYWLWWQQQSDDDTAERQDALQAEMANLQRRVDQAEDAQAQIDAVQEQLETQLAALQRSQARLRDTLASAASQAVNRPVQPGSWRTAEAEYLLRIANHRLLMERDALGAHRLLSLADEILAQVDGFAYHDVRVLLADELAALRDTRHVDVQGVYLRLQALRDAMGRLPLRLAEYTARQEDAAESSANAEASLLDALLERLAGLVRFRRHDEDQVRPLLAPRQAAYLELRLGLALDRAQLAALRFKEGVYRGSLNDARDLLRRYVDNTRRQSIEVAAQLDELAELDIATPLPDISASLARLAEIRQARTAEQTAQ